MGSRVKRSDERILFGLSGARCSNCRDLVIEKQEDGTWYHFSQIHHIQGRDKDALFIVDDIPEEDLHKELNLIVLCPTCHVKIHKSDDYPIELVLQIKESHERWVVSQLGSETNPDKLGEPINPQEAARIQLKNVLKTLEDVLDASESLEPTYFRYPYPKWVDFENHIYRRMEVDLLKDDLKKKSISLLVGKPGSGKTVLLQMVGYEVIQEFDFVFYEDFANPSDQLLRWHLHTNSGDEYRLSDCLKEIADLTIKSGKGSRVLVILDNVHTYTNFTRHLQNLIPSCIPERVTLLLAMRPRYTTIMDEHSELERKSREGVIDIKPVEGIIDRDNPYDKFYALPFKPSHDFKGRIPLVAHDTPSLIVPEDSITCRVLTDNRTMDVVLEILRKGGVKFEDEAAGENWVRARIGANLSLLAFFILGMTEDDGRVNFDERYFCNRVVKRVQSLEESLIDQQITVDYSESRLRMTLQALLKTLAWFTFLGVPLPEKYLLEQRKGLLKNIDERTMLAVCTFLLSRREITKGRIGDYVNYSLPHDSLGTVFLQCLMDVDFSGMSKHSDARMLTEMGLRLVQYLNQEEKNRLMTGLMLNSIIDVLVEPEILNNHFKDVEELTWLLTNTLLMPGFIQNCESLPSSQGLRNALAMKLQESTIPIIFDILYFNLIQVNMVDVLLDDKIINQIIYKIEIGENPSFLLAGLPKKPILWYHPRVREAVIVGIRNMILSSDGVITLPIGLLDFSEINQDNRIIEVVRGSIHKILSRIEKWPNSWGTLAEFSYFEDVLGNNEVIKAVLSKNEQISWIDIDAIERILKHDGYLINHQFHIALLPFLESISLLELSFVLRNDTLRSFSQIQKIVYAAVIASDEPWKIIISLKTCEQLKEMEWGQNLLEIITQRMIRAIHEMQPPYIKSSEFIGTECLCSEKSIVTAMEQKSNEIALLLSNSEEKVSQIMPILVILWLLPSGFKTGNLEKSVSNQSENIIKHYYHFPAIAGSSPIDILLSFPELAKEDIWVSFVESRIKNLGPCIEDLHVIAQTPYLKQNKKIRKLIEKGIKSTIASFYSISTNRDMIKYICEQLPFLKKKRVVKKALKALGIS